MESVYNDYEEAVEAIKKDASQYRYVSEKLKKNIDFIKTIVKNSAEVFLYADEEMKKNLSFVCLCLKSNSEVFKYIPENLKDDKNFLEQAVSYNSGVFKYIPENLKDDKNFMLKVVRYSEYAGESISEKLSKDKTFMMECVKMRADLFAGASLELQNDKELILEAAKTINKGDAFFIFHNVGKDIWTDREFIIKLNKIRPSFIHNDCREEILKKNSWIREDREMLLTSVKTDPYSITNFNIDSIINDENYLLELINIQPHVFSYLPKELTENKEFVLKALKKRIECQEYISDSLRDDDEFNKSYENIKEDYLKKMKKLESWAKQKKFDPLDYNYRQLEELYDAEMQSKQINSEESTKESKLIEKIKSKMILLDDKNNEIKKLEEELERKTKEERDSYGEE